MFYMWHQIWKSSTSCKSLKNSMFCIDSQLVLVLILSSFMDTQGELYRPQKSADPLLFACFLVWFSFLKIKGEVYLLLINTDAAIGIEKNALSLLRNITDIFKPTFLCIINMKEYRDYTCYLNIVISSIKEILYDRKINTFLTEIKTYHLLQKKLNFEWNQINLWYL